MKTTAAVLRELQDYYASLEIKPKHGDIAREAKLPKATITRYLNGTTKGGDPERVRAICIALEREDLVAKLPARPDIKTTTDVWDLLTEQKLADRESNLEEVGYERQLREESEKRLLAEIERITVSKDKSIGMLNDRIGKIEKDKENQTLVNKTLLSDKSKIQGELEVVRSLKRKHDKALVLSLVGNVLLLILIVAYLLVYDLPNPGHGILG